MTKWRETFKGYERARVNGKLKQDDRRLAQQGERMNDLVAAHVEICKLLADDQLAALDGKWHSVFSRNWEKRAAAIAVIRKKLGNGWEETLYDAEDSCFRNFPNAGWDVMWALGYKKIISEVDFEILVYPWVKVMGRTWEA